MSHDDSREKKVLEQQQWQRIAMPLSVIREMREIIVVALLLEEDDPTFLLQSLKSISQVEKQLLLEARHLSSQKLIDYLNLDQRYSWEEIMGHLHSADDQVSISVIKRYLPLAMSLIKLHFSHPSKCEFDGL